MSHDHLPELIVHIPEVDPSRRRWFLVSVVITAALVLFGWGYFLIGQLGAFTQSVPKTLASDFFPTVVDTAKDVSQETVADFQETVAPLASEVLVDLEARIEQQATMQGAIDIMVANISAE